MQQNAQINRKLKWTKIGLLLFFVGLDIFYNCTISVKSQAFTYYKKPIQAQKLFRLDGYYYSNSCSNEENYSFYYFFYPDGFVLRGYHVTANKTLKEIDAHLDSIFHISKPYTNTVQDRGAFVIEKDSLKMQLFACNFNCAVVSKKMQILNDSTFLRVLPTDLEEYKDYQRDNFCDTFHFKKLTWKPDSTYQIGFEKQLKKGKSR
jgi:hypothetical protein